MDRHCSLLKAGRTTAIQQYYKQEGWKPRLAVALSLLLFGCYQWSNTAIFAADGLTKTEKEQETRKFGENLILEMIKANPKESAQPSNQTNQKIDSLAPSGSNQASKTPLGTPATTFTPAVSTPSPAIPASTMSSVTMPTMPNTVPADTGMQNISGDDRQWMKVTPESQSQRTPTAISPAGSLKTAKPGAENDRANEQSALVIPPLLNQNALTPNSASTEQIHNQTGAAVAPPVLKNQDNSTSLFPPSSGKTEDGSNAKPQPAESSPQSESQTTAGEAKNTQQQPGDTARQSSNNTADNANVAKKSTAPKIILRGRIEELQVKQGAQFPIQQSSLLEEGGASTLYSGSSVGSFPSNMLGIWGGILQLQRIQIVPLAYQLDPAETKQTAQLARPGIRGQVNFTFYKHGTKTMLEPANITFMSMPALGNGTNNMASALQQMSGAMPCIWTLHLGSTQGVSLSGNTVRTVVLRNDIRQLSPKVLEQQIVTCEESSNTQTGRSRHSYSESVVRFTDYDASRRVVQAASVDYSKDRQFLRKMVFAGYVTKGAVQSVPPWVAVQVVWVVGVPLYKACSEQVQIVHRQGHLHQASDKVEMFRTISSTRI